MGEELSNETDALWDSGTKLKDPQGNEQALLYGWVRSRGGVNYS
jgi:hypothetical protein